MNDKTCSTCHFFVRPELARFAPGSVRDAGYVYGNCSHFRRKVGEWPGETEPTDVCDLWQQVRPSVGRPRAVEDDRLLAMLDDICPGFEYRKTVSGVHYAVKEKVKIGKQALGLALRRLKAAGAVEYDVRECTWWKVRGA